MISRIRHSVLTRILCGLMGLYLLNISVDPADSTPGYLPEDLSINDQESLVEVVVEKMLGYENAIGEYDDHESEGHYKKNQSKTELVVYLKPEVLTPISYFVTQQSGFPDFSAPLTRSFPKINTPPPKI